MATTNFACDCSVTVDDCASVYNERFVVARTEHKCCECWATIKPGEKYHKVSGCWDGRWSTYSTCLPCSTIREHYCPHGSYFGMLEDHIEECLGFSYLYVPEADDGSI